MAVPLLLLLMIAAPDAGLSAQTDGVVPAARRGAVAGSRDGGAETVPLAVERAVPTPLPLRSISGTRAFADVQSGASTTGGRLPAVASPREPPNQTAVREPALVDAGAAVTEEGRPGGGRGDAGEGLVGLSRRPPPSAPVDAGDRLETLVEQSRDQSEALQALAAQQAAAEQARAAEQQARTQRVLALEDARGSIGTVAQSLQTGNWDTGTLAATGAVLRRSADAAAAAGAGNEAARTAEAASLLDAAQAALSQRNAQQAQWYLARASQLLTEAQIGREHP